MVAQFMFLKIQNKKIPLKGYFFIAIKAILFLLIRRFDIGHFGQFYNNEMSNGVSQNNNH